MEATPGRGPMLRDANGGACCHERVLQQVNLRLEQQRLRYDWRSAESSYEEERRKLLERVVRDVK